MAKHELRIGKYSFSTGDFIEVLAQGRKYRLQIQEIDDYNNIIGTDPNGNPIYIKISKISVIRKMTQQEFTGGESDSTTK
ncbi:conserved lipothrixviral protein [Sulfolobus islandicus filamentous virus 2]|uniref:Conserved lipothrixviral protein n=1 Tax=Sulfolobus islandicus filamentous virus 2 TaxID=1902331 RepID=A0A1D8BJ68_SIFV|nr:conserved lipothrixviral protein [Sulfolobus islandicus filamentous virus 2]